MLRTSWGGATATIRLGLALAAGAGVLAAIAPSGVLVEGPSREMEGVIGTLDPGAAVGALGVAAAVLLLAAIAVPRLWARLAGLALATALAATCGLIVVTGRTSDDFASDAEVSLGDGGVLLAGAFWLALIGVGVALTGFRRLALAPGAGPDGEGPEPDVPPEAEAEAQAGPGGARASGKATVALVLGIAGFVVVLASPLAVALGTLALGEIRTSEGRLAGRGLALTGMVLGMVALCLLAALVGVGTLASRPE